MTNFFYLKEPKEPTKVLLEEIWDQEVLPQSKSKPNIIQGNGMGSNRQNGRPLRDYNGEIPVTNQLKANMERISRLTYSEFLKSIRVYIF